MYKKLLLLFAVVLFVIRISYASQLNTPLAAIEVTLVDSDAIAYATFHCINQKVISNNRGIFTTHNRTANVGEPYYTAQQWRLSQSTDGGQTFMTVYESMTSSNSPLLETDSSDNIYFLDHPMPHTLGQARLNRFTNDSDFMSLQSTLIPRGQAGKYAMVLDEARQQIYYIAQNDWFHVIGTDGAVRNSYLLLHGGPNANMMYPYLAMSENGDLYAAWHTQDFSTPYVRRSIHVIKSTDGGSSWTKLDGATSLTTPIVDDDTGPADMINDSDELNVTTPLTGFMIKNGKIHFIYQVDRKTDEMRYKRYDIAAGQWDIDTNPFFNGGPPDNKNNSGFLAVNSSVPGSTIYFVTGTDDRTRLICFASDDNGATWYEYAVGDNSYPVNKAGWHGIYTVGGARELTADGHIIGTFTEVADFAKSYYEPHSGKAHFFQSSGGTMPSIYCNGGLHIRNVECSL